MGVALLVAGSLLLQAPVPAPTARRFLGVPYLWGGMTAHGIDCSGLVSRVHHANGIRLPRDARLQFEAPDAAPVERDALLPGDLVFFGEDAGAIAHVGLYLGDERYQGARRPR